MNKEEIANYLRDVFFSPILVKTLSECFESSGLLDSERFTKEVFTNKNLQSKIKMKLAVRISQKYTELGFTTSPDDIEVLIRESGIKVINLKISQNKDDNSSSNLE